MEVLYVRSVLLEDVYHVLGLKKNITSVSQLTDHGKYVPFGPNDVKILSNVNHIAANVLFISKRKESLYILSSSYAYVEKTWQNASITFWHNRQGHVGYHLLPKISIAKLFDGVPIF